MPTVGIQVTDAKVVPQSSNARPAKRAKPKPKRKQRRRATPMSYQQMARTGRNPPILDKGSQCVKDFVRAYRDPFTVCGICLPTNPSWPSRKLCTRQYVNFYAGTQGTGYIVIQPDASQDTTCGWFTTTAWAGGPTNAITFTPGAQVATFTNNQSPYTAAQFGNGANLLQQRCVIAAIRIRYIGTTLNMSGIIIPMVVPQYQTINGVTPAQLRASIPDAESEPVNRKFHTIRWTPTSSDLANYYTQSYTNMDAPMIILVEGFTPSSPFDVEIVYHHEIVGTGLDATPSYGSNLYQNFVSKVTNLGMRAARSGVVGDVMSKAAGVAHNYARSRLRGGPTMLRDDL